MEVSKQDNLQNMASYFLSFISFISLSCNVNNFCQAFFIIGEQWRGNLKLVPFIWRANVTFHTEIESGCAKINLFGINKDSCFRLKLSNFVVWTLVYIATVNSDFIRTFPESSPNQAFELYHKRTLAHTFSVRLEWKWTGNQVCKQTKKKQAKYNTKLKVLPRRKYVVLVLHT